MNNKLYYRLKIFISQILSLFQKYVYTHLREFRSDSENGVYIATIANVLKNEKTFNNFKRSYKYREILEHVSEDQGLQYLNILKSRDDGILDKALNTVLVSDDVGNPIKYKYEGFNNLISPTSLRYLKVCSDLKKLFGDDLGNIAEIGCGYGGQTFVNDQLLSVKTAKLFDLPLVNKLIDKYLNSFLLNGSYTTTHLNQETTSEYNLVISNYAFSELPKILQIKYIDKVLSRSERGYLTMNSGLEKSENNKLTIFELRKLLPKFEILSEEPLTSPKNYIIVWGHLNELDENYFRLKK